MSCPIWSDIDAAASTVPAERWTTAVESLRSRCHHLFPGDIRDETLRAALHGRLCTCRDSWRCGQKRLRKKAAAGTGSDQNEDPEELTQLTEGEHSTGDSALQSNSRRSLKVVLKVPDNLGKAVGKQVADQHGDYTSNTSHIHQPEAPMSTTVLDSSEDSRTRFLSPNSTTPFTSESKLSEQYGDNAGNIIQTTDKLANSSKKSTVSLSGEALTEDSEVGDTNRSLQHESVSATADDGDTIIVDVEGRKAMMLAEQSKKKSPMKRQRASSSRGNAKVCYNKTLIDEYR